MAAILCLVLMMLSCELSAARRDPGGDPSASGAHPRHCKLCWVVALPVASVAFAAAVVALVICILRRRRNKATTVAATAHDGRYDQDQPLGPLPVPAAGVDYKVIYDKLPAGSTGASSENVGYKYNNKPAGSTGDSSENVGYDHPMSINATMARSPTESPSWATAASPPAVHAHSAPSHSSTRRYRSPASSVGSPLRWEGHRPPPPPVPGRAKPEEKAVTGDPLAMYSPSISVLLEEFDYEQLEEATSKFGRKSQLGRRGGTWVAFKGTKFVKDEGLPATVVIKRFHTKFSEEDFNRIRGELITQVHSATQESRQPACLGKGRFHLVYDYMTNGSLEQHLFREASRGGLSWLLRHCIVRDVAQGLYQLHVTCEPHRSITASSIMLDYDSTAHLDDHFGYRPDGTGPSSSSRAVRSVDDVAASLQADIGDLGTVILELVSGRRRSTGTGTTPLDSWVWARHGDGSLLDAVDPRLDGRFHQDQASKLLLLGLACSHPDPKMRPQIHDVREILLDRKPMPEVPLSKPTAPN